MSASSPWAQDASGANDKPAVQRSATLEVTPVDAQKLALGQQLGQLSLVLRKPGEEQNIAAVETVSLNDLRYSYLRRAACCGRARRLTGRHRCAAEPAAPCAAGSPSGRAGASGNQYHQRYQGCGNQGL